MALRPHTRCADSTREFRIEPTELAGADIRFRRPIPSTTGTPKPSKSRDAGSGTVDAGEVFKTVSPWIEASTSSISYTPSGRE